MLDTQEAPPPPPFLLFGSFQFPVSQIEVEKSGEKREGVER